MVAGTQPNATPPPPFPPPEPPDPATEERFSKRTNLVSAFRFAFDGVLRTLCTQRNMKIHWVSGLAVMLVGMALELDISARASVLFCVAVVLTMEILNTAFEAFVDLHVKQYARHAMIAKDAAAAAVLVLASASVVVFGDILFHRWRMVLHSEPAIVRTLIAGLPILIVVTGILAIPRSLPAIGFFGVAAVGLLTYLAWYSRDEVFSLAALVFVAGAVVARVREPALVVLKS